MYITKTHRISETFKSTVNISFSAADEIKMNSVFQIHKSELGIYFPWQILELKSRAMRIH